MTFKLVEEVKVGDLLMIGSVLIATMSLLYSLYKDRRLRRREYADRIRKSASETLAATERWREIAIRHFADTQPILTDADGLLVKEQNIVLTRDSLWRALMALEIQTSSRVLDEKLEGAYAGLYGYDPAVHDIFSTATAKLRSGFAEAHHTLLMKTQEDVCSLEEENKPFVSAQLGNRLRESTCEVEHSFAAFADEALTPLRHRMLALIQSNDHEIFAKQGRSTTHSAA